MTRNNSKMDITQQKIIKQSLTSNSYSTIFLAKKFLNETTTYEEPNYAKCTEARAALLRCNRVQSADLSKSGHYSKRPANNGIKMMN